MCAPASPGPPTGPLPSLCLSEPTPSRLGLRQEAGGWGRLKPLPTVRPLVPPGAPAQGTGAGLAWAVELRGPGHCCLSGWALPPPGMSVVSPPPGSCPPPGQGFPLLPTPGCSINSASREVAQRSCWGSPMTGSAHDGVAHDGPLSTAPPSQCRNGGSGRCRDLPRILCPPRLLEHAQNTDFLEGLFRNPHVPDSEIQAGSTTGAAALKPASLPAGDKERGRH